MTIEIRQIPGGIEITSSERVEARMSNGGHTVTIVDYTQTPEAHAAELFKNDCPSCGCPLSIHSPGGCRKNGCGCERPNYLGPG